MDWLTEICWCHGHWLKGLSKDVLIIWHCCFLSDISFKLIYGCLQDHVDRRETVGHQEWMVMTVWMVLTEPREREVRKDQEDGQDLR